ncbi:hypothetical protein LSAT2_014570 [Lamellibrachia satsuma]|nr:hypothetical protein LSAT2_014570 [Lamellibrachia satsuma]
MVDGRISKDILYGESAPGVSAVRLVLGRNCNNSAGFAARLVAPCGRRESKKKWRPSIAEGRKAFVGLQKVWHLRSVPVSPVAVNQIFQSERVLLTHKSTATMSIRMSLVGLFLLATLRASVGVSEIDCINEINRCGGDGMVVLTKATRGITLDEYGKDALENFCRDKGKLETCLESAKDMCPKGVVEQYQKNLKMVTANCEYLDCTKKIIDCGSDVAGMFRMNMTSTTDSVHYLALGNGGIDDICRERDALKTCIMDSTPQCSDQVAEWNVQLDALKPVCEMLPCNKEIKTCFGKLDGYLATPTYDIWALQNVCSDATATDNCIQGVTECPAETVQYYKDVTSIYLSKCTTLDACQKNIRDCAGESANTFFGAVGDRKFEVATVEKLCSVKDSLSTCFEQSTACPDEYTVQYEATLENYVTQGCVYMPCSKKLEACAGDVAEIFMSGTGYRTDRLDKLCEQNATIQQCLNNLRSECPDSYIELQKAYLQEGLNQGCIYNPCVEKVDACNGEVGKIFMTGSNFGAGGLEKLCEKKEAIQACFEGMREKCPSSYAESQITLVTQAQKGCDYTSCAKKVQDCGVNVMENVDITSLKKETLVSFCENVIKAKTCLDAIGSECPQEAKDKSKKTMTIGADQCAEIGGNRVAIVLKLEMTWDEKYSDLESEEAKPLVADLKTSLTEIYKNTEGFKEVTIVRLFKSSVGVDHSVEYEQELSKRDLVNVAATINTALSKNGDSLTVGDTTVRAAGKPEMLFGGKSHATDDPCGLYTMDSKCQNGGTCDSSYNGARCVCVNGFSGDYCETMNSSAHRVGLAVLAVLVSIGASFLLGV